MFSVVWSFLSSSLLFWEIAGYFSTAIVIFGCVGEYIAEFTKVPKDETSKHKWSKMSLIILTAGIAGELMTAIQSSAISGRVIANLEANVTRARQSAVDAETAAHGAVDDFEVAQQSLGEVTTRVGNIDSHLTGDESRIAGIDAKQASLESRVAWRTISKEQLRIMQDQLQTFRGRSLVVSWSTNDPEQNAFAPEFIHALHSAGINAISSPAGMVALSLGSPMPSSGMLLIGNPTDPFIARLYNTLRCDSLDDTTALIPNINGEPTLYIRPKVAANIKKRTNCAAKPLAHP